MKETLSPVLGQEKPNNALRLDYKNDRLAHSYLFYGPSGVGKKLSAKELFKHLNGHKTGCTCRFCAQVNFENHPDLLVVSPDGRFIKIDQVRKIQHFLALMPINSVAKMAILDDAHDLKIEASNALLKTLEEPPEKSILILITSIPERLIVTIKSRCRQIRFNSILMNDIAYYLSNDLKVEKKKARLTAAISGGIFGKALQIGNDAVFWANRDDMIELALRLPGMKSEECLNEAENLVETIKKQLRKQKKAKINEFVIRKLCNNLSIIQSVFRDALVFKETNETGYILNSDRTDDIINNLSIIDSFKLVGYIEKIEKTKRMLSQNVNALLLLQSLFLNKEH